MTNARHARRGGLLALVGAGALALAIAGPAAVLALVNDGGLVDVRVANRTQSATGYTTPANAKIDYLGDQDATQGPAGTGTFDSFVRVQASPTESGYNTNGTLEFDTKSGTWTHAIKVSDIPVVGIGGVPHWELFADINESNSTPLISLNDVEVFFANSATVTGYPGFGGAATPVYDFAGDIRINDVNQGSGRGDLRYSIPLTNIQIPADCGYKDPACNTWFVLYSRWGTTTGYESDGGFEEWKVKQYPYVLVDKTATTTFTRTYEWLIDKSVDDTEISIAEGGTATFNYDVAVTPDGFTDSDWAVNGTISIKNPSTQDPVIISSVADVVSTGIAANVSCGVSFPYTLAKNGTLNCTYSAPLPDGSTRTNTATVTLNYGGIFTDTAAVAFGGPTTEVNRVITVVDDKTNPPTTVTLGTSDYYAGPFLFEYSLDKQGVAGTCTDYTNTATISETGQDDDVTVTVCVGQDLTVEKTATASYDRTYHWLIDKAVDKTRVDIAAGGTATFNYDVTVTPDGFTDSGWTLAGTITVTNPNDWQAITADVTDVTDVGGGAVCTVTDGEDVVVPASGSVTLDYSCAFASQPAYTGENTATATWDAALYATPTGTASGSADVNATLDDETNRVITVVDDKTNPPTTVTLGTSDYYAGPFLFEYSLDKQGVAGTCTDYTNTATISETGQDDDVTVTVCVGQDLTVEKTATGTFDREYLWNISKDADATSVTIAEGGSHTFNYTVDVWQTGIEDSGWELSGVITVTNPNDWQAITLTDVTDVVDNGGTCTVDAGPWVVPADGTLDIGYSCTYASAPSSLSGDNSVTVTWDKDAAKTPSGSADWDQAFTLAQDGSTNKTVNVTDTYAGDLGAVTATDSAPFATASFTYSRTESGVPGTCTEYDNTATIVETEQSDDATVELCVTEDLTVSKDANPTFTRTWTWDITKDVDASSATIDQGGTATFNYTVSVSHDAGTDSNWKVEGTIHVSNPNDFQAITLTSLTDAIDNGGVCTITEAGPYVVPASGSIHVDYECTYASAPSSLSGTNTATATWDAATYKTPSGTASGTATADFDTPTSKVDECVEVTDTLAGTLGTVCVGDPAGDFTFTYSKSFSPIDCGTFDYDNTAAFTTNNTGATGSDTETVTIIVNCAEGCTPGYWKTHPESWVGYTTDQTLESVFDVPDAFGYDNVTLMDALGFQGGSDDAGAAEILLRAGVAALLNAANSEITYPLSEAQVISQVNTALAGTRGDMLALARMLDDYNNLGCYF